MSGKRLTIEQLEKQVEELKRGLKEREESNKISEENLRKILMLSPDPICIIEVVEKTILEVNEKFLDTTGFSRAESIDKTFAELNLFTNKEDAAKLTETIQEGSSPIGLETVIRKKSGQTTNISIAGENMIYEGKSCFILYFRSDSEITATKNNYKLLAENSTDVIWTMNLDGSFCYISPSVKNLRGYSPEEVLKQTIQEVLTPSSAQKVKILLQELIRHDRENIEYTDSYLTEVEQICRDGSKVWTEVITSPIKDENGRLIKILGVSRNIQGKKIAEQKARERSNTVESIFRSAPLGIGKVTDRCIDMVNDRFCKMIGYTKEEIIGKNARFLYESEAEYQRVGKVKYDKILKSGTGDVSTRFLKKNGQTIDVIMSSSPIDQEDWGKGVVFSALDISALNEAESKLEENQKKYSSLFNHINDAILIHPWIKGGFSNFIEVNEIACKLYGYSREEFLNLKADDLTIEEEILYHKTDEFRKEILDKGSMVFETVHMKKSGEKFPVEISSNTINVNDESIILAVIRDITDRKKAESAIYESELRFRELFENSPESIITIDRLGFITKCNNSFLEMTGMESSEILDYHFTKIGILSAKQVPEYLTKFNQVINIREKQVFEINWTHSDGRERKGLAHIGPILQNNKVSGIQAQIKDITQQKEFEKNLVLAKEKAEQSDRLKTSFMETMSHELRTPLNAVIGFSNLIQEEKDIESIKDMNHFVTENGKKLLNIIESIFDISMLETQSAILKTEEFSINELFSDLEITLQGMIELDQKSDIKTYYQPDRRFNDFKLISDKQRLKQLLTNLLTNAVRYTDRGSIRYGYSQLNGNIEFFVSDTGIGIAPDKTDMIFEKFTQIDNSSTRTRGGVGLGLSIVSEIAKMLEGSLRIESKPSQGSTFYFTLPSKRRSKQGNKGYGLDLREKNFIIVEDIESNYLYLERILTESGASVLWAQSGHDAIELAKKLEKVDMVLMDIRMPDMNGYDITKAIKKIRPELPIIAQTAYAMASDQEEAIDAGCADHISKPIRVEDLMNKVRKHLNMEKSALLTI